MKNPLLPALLITLSALALPVHAFASDTVDGERRGGPAHQPPGPPPEAFELCKGKTAGASATLKTPDGKSVSGSCQLVFRPDRAAGEGGKPQP